MEHQDRMFDYKGFRNRSGFYINKVKNLVGKGLDTNEVYRRRQELNEYYKNNPNKLHERNRSESKKSFAKKLSRLKSVSMIKRSNKLNKEIKATGSNYTPGEYSKTALKYTAPVAAIPLPGTTVIPIAAMTGGALVDRAKMIQLEKRNKKIKLANDKLKQLKRKIKNEEKLQIRTRKVLEQSLKS